MLFTNDVLVTDHWW